MLTVAQPGLLRDQFYFTLAELNAANRDCVAAINAKTLRKIWQSPRYCWRSFPALGAMAAIGYSYAEWKRLNTWRGFERPNSQSKIED